MKPTADEIKTLLEFLDGLGWCEAKTIKVATRIDPRTVRLVAEQSGKLIGGQRGYRRADQATYDEIIREINSLRSRVKKMTKRADTLSDYLHSARVFSPAAAQ